MSITRIAEAAKVSYATAWRIINNQPGSSEEAATAVRTAMGELGYDPASGRRKGRGRPSKGAEGIRTHNIALLHLRTGTTISTAILNRVQRMLSERNLNLIFAHVEKPDDPLPQALRSGNVDGILGYGQFPKDALAACPRLRQIPAVWMMTRADSQLDEWGDRVQPDNSSIGLLAAKHLIARGHRRLAYFNPNVRLAVYRQRLANFMTEAQLSAPDATVRVYAADPVAGDDINLDVQRVVDEYLATPADERATALFVPVDRVTLRVYRQLERAGVRVGPGGGQEVEIVSCDNEQELLSLMHPAPPSIDINRTTIARLAVERLWWRMKNGMRSPSVVTTVSPTLDGPALDGVENSENLEPISQPSRAQNV